MSNEKNKKPLSLFFVILENQDLMSTLQHSFFKSLAETGTLLTNYHGINAGTGDIAHFSYLQYLSLTSGDAIHINNDTIKTFDVENLADLFEEKGITWKSYIENLPEGHPFLYNNDYNQLNYLDYPANHFYPSYVRKHNPFINYLSVQKDPKKFKNLVNATKLLDDIDNNTVPEYSLYIPNMFNNAHNTNLSYANSAMIARFIPLFKNKNFTKDRVFIFLFDESYFKGDPTNLIYCTFWGDKVKQDHKINKYYNHYNMYQFVIEHFKLKGYKNPKFEPIKDIFY